MTYLADAHRDWHAVNGAYAICPLDCGAMAPGQAEAEELSNWIAYTDSEADERRVRCAHCKDRHANADVVRACAALHELQAERVEERAATPTYAEAIGYAGACEDGRCDVYNRCHKHRAQDAARGDRDAHFRAYND
jgi:hypothetical protein